MNTLEEEKFIREEKQRKQDLYRLMLDEQVMYNKSKKEREKNRHYTHSFDQDSVRIQKDTPKGQKESNNYFPSIREERKTEEIDYKRRKDRDLRQSTDEDRTQIYLSNCEEIIKNLRELKRKKKQQENHQISSMNSQPSWSLPKDNKNSVQQYPRGNYFSSQGTPYNKSFVSNSSSRYKYKDKLKTLEDSQDGKDQEKKSKKQFLLRKRQMGSIGYKTNIQKESLSKNVEGKQSTGIKAHSRSGLHDDAENNEKAPNQSQRVYRKLHQPKFMKFEREDRYDSIQYLKHSKVKNQDVQDTEKEKGKQKEQENKKQQKQLSQCLIELTKFLKKHNDKEQQNKIRERGAFHNLTKTQQVQVQTSINPQKVTLENQKEENFDKLQSSAIKALKKLNQQSQKLVNVISKVEKVQTEKKSHQQRPQQIEKGPNQKVFLSKQSYLSKNRSVNQANKVENKPNPVKKDFSIEKQFEILSKDNINLTQHQEKDKNKQLLDLLRNQLERQGDQNQELSYCMKQLTEYLKDQNRELEYLKNSRQIQASLQENSSTERQLSSPNDLREINEQEEQEESYKPNQQRFHNAVLTNLKKARMKGNLFREKVESFRKKHHKLDILTQKRQQESIQAKVLEGSELPSNRIREDKSELKSLNSNMFEDKQHNHNENI